MKFTIYQETLRETWKFQSAEITIDTWPGLETYSEIEAQSEEQVREIAQKLGFEWEKKIITSAQELFMNTYGLSHDETAKKLEHITFEQNPFQGLKRNPI